MSERKPLAEMSNWELRIETGHWLGYLITMRDECYYLTTPDGNQYELPRYGDQTAVEAIRYEALGSHLPNWPEEVNAAARDLFSTGNHWVTYEKHNSLYHVTFHLDLPDDEWEDFDSEHESPARAITEAFCAMKRQEVGNG